MEMSDVMLPIFAVVMCIMGFVGGCDRWRLSEVEKDCRNYRDRILKLEAKTQILEMRLDDVKKKLDWQNANYREGGK